ncbi:precorrin-8X methylmutase [Desulfovibrio cuneatus]|uniref:precorrin-8X methylmutase n=1 Tax=Desulfovibrio cuneatus TaxID=159728 RepID=UPI0004162C9E|nr:precorrin-8X methylmutase [Desulfovibrio cuneatus]
MITLDPHNTPQGIEDRSFAIIDAEIDPKPFHGDAWQVARRLVHTSGDTGLVADLWLPDAAVAAGVAAIRAGAPIFTDTEMARAGMPLRRLSPFGCTVQCLLAAPGVAELAVAEGITRSRAGVLCLGKAMEGSIIAIGNAPTALLAMLEAVAENGIMPALVVGMPVGFVNAAESKELLVQQKALHSLVLRGRRGGSPLAAATVNALACLASDGAGV